MKRLIIAAIILFAGLCLQAQNTISLTLQPIDKGIGLKYDHYFVSYTECYGGAGLYTSVAYGNYKLYDQYINDHVRIAGGISAPFQSARVSIGLVYHRFGEVKGDFPDKTLDPLSFEIGVTAHRGKFGMGLRYDILKHESCIDIGFNFR